MTIPTATPTLNIDEPTPLRLDGPLPSGTVVLEASAGTGKTYAIAALATRAVAEGRCDLPDLLLVTFTRAATAELRDRVRRRLVQAADHLAGCEAALAAGRPLPDPGDDLVLRCLAADHDELAARRRRLATAVTDFDAATISTIHGFSQQVLRAVGLNADVRRDATLLEDPSRLLDEVVDDVYVRRYLHTRASAEGEDGLVRPTRRQVHDVAKAVVGSADATVVPAPDDPDPQAAELGALALELRAEVAARKRRHGLLAHDDLLLSLRAALADRDRGDAAVAVLRERYRWALVDEFQDTDPVQWDILDRAFRDPADPTRALVLIGDPKQAIYGFRGADVQAYLAATRAAETRHSLTTNHRSDAPLLAATDRLLSGTVFGDEDIRFRRVEATEAHATAALHDPADPAALRFRVVGDTPGGAGAPAVQAHVARDVAATIVGMLPAPGGAPRPRLVGERRALACGDIAVLVRSNAQATTIQRTLRDAGVPSVVNGVGSVLRTTAGPDWRTLLEALERPSDQARARRVAISPWVGWRATDLADADDERWDRLHDQLHRWAHVLRDHGVSALERAVAADTDLRPRLLRDAGGERQLTDLHHVGELLHTAELGEERGPSALLSWLRVRRDEAIDDTTTSDEQARRLESDDEAVQILTVHRSKGLQYRVVLCPFLWGGGQNVQSPLTVHDPTSGGRLVDLGPRERDGYDDHLELARREGIGEALRLLYVAVTRAQHQVVLWWACIGGTERSPLARVLFGRDERGEVLLDDKVTLPDPEAVPDRLRERFGDLASVTEVPVDLSPPRWRAADGEVPALEARRFERVLDRAWRRTSYSGIAALASRRAAEARALVLGAPEPAVAVPGRARVRSEAEEGTKDDEPDAPRPTPPPVHGVHGVHGVDRNLPDTTVRTLRAHALPLGGLRGGTHFGTFVHAVLEHTDFAADPLEDALTEQVRHQAMQAGIEVAEAPLVAGLAAAIRTPLGPLAGSVRDGAGGAAAEAGRGTTGDAARGRTLADVARADRLDELEFELPLAGGDRGRREGAKVQIARIADLLDRHLPADDPLVGYADHLRRPDYEFDLRGYLTGSIDLVLRVQGRWELADGAVHEGPRYLVADHKTNRLVWPEEPTAYDYRPRALVEEMVHHDYPLQALLYQAALHRLLRWRQPAYDPARHLGGALYLFLRGMTGPATPVVDGQPCGVAAWAPPAPLIVALSDLLDGQEVAR
jgi:exodeoxyribonuclease V beta subunit